MHEIACDLYAPDTVQVAEMQSGVDEKLMQCLAVVKKHPRHGCDGRGRDFFSVPQHECQRRVVEQVQQLARHPPVQGGDARRRMREIGVELPVGERGYVERYRLFFLYVLFHSLDAVSWTLPLSYLVSAMIYKWPYLQDIISGQMFPDHGRREDGKPHAFRPGGPFPCSVGGSRRTLA